MKDEIIKKINKLFGDTSQSQEATREQLEEIRDEIEMLLASLDDE